MLIINGANIRYTQGDTFKLTVSSRNGFNENSRLRFVVAEKEGREPIIDKTFDMNNDGFVITLDAAEREKIRIRDYVYKLVLIAPDGTIITQKSGDFIVKWGV